MKATAFLCNATWFIVPLVMGAASIQAAQESLFSSSSFPPANAVYTQWAAGPRHYDDVKVRFRNARFSRWTPQLDQLDVISGPETNSVTCDVEMDVSTDDGQTYQTCSAQARGIITVKPGTGSSGVPSYDTELLQLDVSGGTLPLGLRLRESPTLQSTGQTTVRAVVLGGGTTNGASLISSFFDVFTEVSIDDGQTWSSGADGTNAPESSVLEMVGADPEPAVAPIIHPTGLFPSPCDALSCPPGAQVSFANAATGESMIVSNLTMKLFTSDSYLNLDTVTDATSTVYDCVVQMDLSTDGGNTFESVSGNGHWSLPQLPQGSHSGLREFQAAITQLNISGLPGGIQLQADASQVSYSYAKRAAIQDNQRKDVCALDIVPQLSSDGGQTWTTGDQPMQLRLVQQAIDAGVSDAEFPPGGSEFIDVKPPPHVPHPTAGGPYSIVLSGFSGSQPLSSGNETNVLNFSAHLSGEIFDGTNWNSFSNLSVSVDCGVWRLDSAGVATGDTNLSFYDMEITALNLQGVTLPGGVLLRESPTRRSLGRGYFEKGDTPTQDRMVSFFDIFTELSFDGGQTWTTATSPATVGLVPSGPSPVPDAPQCPSNITVYASSTNGVAVYYTIPEFFGDCPFGHHLDVSPPSGSTFPVGETTVNVTAWDDCGLSNTCSFTATVIDISLYPVVDWNFPVQSVLPSGGEYFNVSGARSYCDTNHNWQFANDRFYNFTVDTSPPMLTDSPSSDTFTLDVSFDLSQDGGQTYAPVVAKARGIITTKPSNTGTGYSSYETEMVQLDISGGTLPSGVMLRESPSKASLGRTTIQARDQYGNARLSSFFDVFTEISFDGGQTWNSCSSYAAPMHITLYPDTHQLAQTIQPNDLFPPPLGVFAMKNAVSFGGDATNPPVVVGSSAVSGRGGSYKLFSVTGQPTPVGEVIVDGTWQGNIPISLDGGNTWQNVQIACHGIITTKPTGAGGIGTTSSYDTEIIQLDITGPDMPNGIMLRESPTLRSRGNVLVSAHDENRIVSSFFDVFTELSTDNGQTWTAGNQPLRLELQQQALDEAVPNSTFPPVASAFISPASSSITFENGATIDNVAACCFSGSVDLTTLSSNLQTIPLMMTLSGNIRTALGAPSQQFNSGSKSVDCNIAARDYATDPYVEDFFDSELSNFTTDLLPGGIMLRESPTRASLGRVRFQSGDLDGDGAPDRFVMSSFFDIFTELSLDGGQTWSAATAPLTVSMIPTGPSPVPDGPICPSNITVYATSTNGAEVDFTVNEFFGDCPFGHHLDVSPPSGSTFAIGTTTVNVTAWDDCGLSNACSFSVTVLDSTIYSTVDWYFATNLIPPVGSSFVSGNSTLYPLSSGGSVVLRNLAVHDLSGGISPPNPGDPPLENLFTCLAEFEISTNGGQTFSSVSRFATGRYTLTAGVPLRFETSITALDVPDAPGTSTAGIMLRESPSKASLGRVTIQARDQYGNGYAVSSFFDIFTEISLDGGQTWLQQADDVPLHFEMRKESSATDDLLTGGTAEPSQMFPPYTDLYYSSGGTNSSSTNRSSGSGAGKVNISAFTISRFIGGGTIPPGGTNISIEAEVNMLASLDDGQTWTPIKQLSQIQLQATPVSSNANGTVTFDTEMLSLDLSKDGIPDVVLIRESPTLPSRGQFDVTPTGDGSYRIGSFFDIFTEISVDGGQTWTQMDGPFHVSLAGLAPEQPFSSPFLPPTTGRYAGPMSPSFTPGTYQYRFANGIVFSNLVFQSFDQAFAPPQPGDSAQTHSFNCQAIGDISTDNGQTFQPFHAQARLGATTHPAKVEIPNFYEIDILDVSMSGGNLPGGVMVRESPSKASLGRTSVRSVSASDGSTIYAISSFFDIFPEISIDGGNTWTPGVDALTLVLQQGDCATISFNQPTLPPAIVGQPYSQTVTAAGGLSPFAYTAAGNLPPGLTLDSTGLISGTPTTAGTYEFEVTASDEAGCSGIQSFTINVNSTCSDSTAPTVVVTSPKNNAVVTTSTITASGTATDDIEGSQVLYRINGRTWNAYSINPARWITKCSWTGTIDLDPGYNTLETIAVDKCGNRSPVIERRVFYSAQASVIVTVNGFGSLTGPAKLVVGANQLSVGQSYKFSAVPAPNNLFSNIVLYQDDVPTIITAPHNVTFTMNSNTAITVNFVTNRFIANAGMYSGLYMPSSGIDCSNSGPITIHLSKTGAFSGSISWMGQKSSFSGAFGLDGSLIKSAFTGPIDTIPPTLTLSFAPSGHGQITGSLTNPTANWVASILAEQAPFSSANPCPLGGSNYTIVLPGNPTNSLNQPGGDGFAVVKITPNGAAKFSGKFADGSVLSASASLSADLQCPLYQSLYKVAGSKPPTFLGSAIGWLDFSVTSPTGDIIWSHGPVSGIPYSAGLTTVVSIVSSPFTAPPTGGKVIGVDSAEILFQGAGLSSPIDETNATYGGSPAKVSIPPADNPNQIKLMLAPNGLVTGSFAPDPLQPNANLKFYGAVLQNSNAASGFFLNRVISNGTVTGSSGLYKTKDLE